MQRQSRGINGELEQKADAAISSDQAIALSSSLRPNVKADRISNPAPRKE
jgi:hypothetical protein